MNIVYISNKAIYPIIDGGCFAMSNFLECLNTIENVNVKHFAISTKKHPFKLENYPVSLQKKNKPEGLNIQTNFKLKLAKFILSKYESYVIRRFYDENNLQSIINFLSNKEVDLIIFETPFLGPYIESIKKLFNVKILVRTHNVEANIWKEKFKFEKNYLKKFIYKKFAKQIERQEISILKNCDGLISISDIDSQYFKKMIPNQEVNTIPPYIETKNTLIEIKPDLFFMGAMNWYPNIEAVNELINIIFPKIRSKNKNVKLHLAGSFSSSKNELNNIYSYGFVEDKVDFMLNSGILIAPLLSGSGIKIKILEALSLGIPVIGSPKAFEGINIKHQQEVLIANSNEEFVDFAISLIESSSKRSELGLNGKSFIEKNYNKTDICNQLNEFLKRT